MAAKSKSIDEQQVRQWIERGVKKLENMDCVEKKGVKKYGGSGAAGTIWFFGFVGAAFYFLQHATSLGTGVIGLLKAVIWPAILIYYLLNFLKI